MRSFVADDRTAMVDSLRRFAEGGAAAAQGVVQNNAEPQIGFICPGQGAQSVGMARQLMAQEPAFPLPRWNAAIWRPARMLTGP